MSEYMVESVEALAEGLASLERGWDVVKDCTPKQMGWGARAGYLIDARKKADSLIASGVFRLADDVRLEVYRYVHKLLGDENHEVIEDHIKQHDADVRAEAEREKAYLRDLADSNQSAYLRACEGREAAERALETARAEAWDEGVIAGTKNRSGSVIWDLNPYRAGDE